MDSIKAQDIIRHIFKDEDKGVAYVTGLSITDGVEVLTKVLPELIKKAQEKNNVNDEGYFNEIGNVYRKIVVDKLLNADHLWTIYCDSTGYPYMVDDDIVVLYDYTNHARVEEQLGKYGYDISYGIEDKDSMQYEIAHLYRNGCRNIRFTDGKDNELIVSREEIGTYDQYIREDFVTNPGLQNALIKFFQEYRKPGDSTAKAAILRDKEAELKKAIRNADYMVPCTKEETDEEVSISHPYVDITDKVVIFNLKKLTGKLKSFALMVVQDYIWNQVVNNQGKLTTRIYFDEMQNQFQTENQAQFFTDLYARVRKYGAIPTGITQNVETLLERSQGRKLLSNSDFIVLLKQKKTDIRELTEVVNLTPALIRFIEKPKAKGTGLIIANHNIAVPFENPIPKNTKLFEIVGTDAYKKI